MNRKEFENPWPCVVISSRYGGAYEDGKWVALMCWPEHIPDDLLGGDSECHNFFHDGFAGNAEHPPVRQEEIGRGATPDAAVEDLKRRLDKEGVKWR